MTFKEPIDSYHFPYLQQTVSLKKERLVHAWEFKLSNKLYNLISNKQYKLLTSLLINENLELDICRYERFENSIFEQVLLTNDGSPAALQFLEDFISQVENLNTYLENKTWLSFAIENGVDPAIVQTLIENNCAVDYQNDKRDSLLHIAAKTNPVKLSDTRLSAYLQILLDAGVDVNQQNRIGNTALHLVTKKNQPKSMHTLLGYGANPNTYNNEGKTAYHIVLIDKNQLDIGEQMAAYAAPVFHAKNAKGTPLLAAFMSHCFLSHSKLHLPKN